MPENYHGTAFDEPSERAPQTPPPTEQPREVIASASTTAPQMYEQKCTGISSLFSGLGSLRSDDILLLALILLLARSDKEGHNAAEILPMLAILLFIG